MSKNRIRIGFGGGCHWCTEAVFQALRGVHSVEQGFIRSDPPFDGWSEAVIVTFDPAIIDLATLTEVHLRTHASTAAHSMRGKYRSAVYAFDDRQVQQARGLVERFQPEFGGALVTRTLPFVAFKPSDTRFHDYYAKDPGRPFCQAYIDPKLAVLRREFGTHVTAPA